MPQYAPHQKALAHILTIFDDGANKRRLPRYNHLTFQTDKICLIYYGDYSLLRRRDELLMTRSQAPGIVGLILPGTAQQFVTIRAESDCDYQLVSHDAFFTQIAQQQAHQQMYTLLLTQITWQYQREEWLFGYNSLVTVQGAILLLDRLEPTIRAGTNVADFVVKSTNLSRSIVMKSMAFLRQQNAIEINKGKLIRINYLPDIR
ncbi:helix-turn-helix domain-containing protein [Superficieibacter sp. HKU1]|uniref:helix-turn-helix domain-containing protein n=1 Tax=Superficieibacter sp. HKU1 TaxID=3031919 RepID=UPI0023E10328|nr:helix-turn-helix domain-containing protein [Superficieibacter sp. HKU1]WES69816.1 helix-turn-helix domain-containing protein [Superficieibacter sp. HKU1]